MAEQTLEQILNQIVDDAEAITTKMSVEDKAKITKAGANVFAKELEQVVKSKHYRHRETGNDPHLADSIIVQNKNIDGIKNGSSVVGWNYSQSRVGHLIENGTKFPMYTKAGHKYKHGGQVAVHADHFLRDLRNDQTVQDKMLKAEAAAYKKIIDKRYK